MMIKLFLITLLCATLVLANSPGKDSQNALKPNGFVNRSNHLLGHGNLVRRSAQGWGGGAGAEGQAGFGFGLSAGGGLGGGAGAGAGK